MSLSSFLKPTIRRVTSVVSVLKRMECSAEILTLRVHIKRLFARRRMRPHNRMLIHDRLPTHNSTAIFTRIRLLNRYTTNTHISTEISQSTPPNPPQSTTYQNAPPSTHATASETPDSTADTPLPYSQTVYPHPPWVHPARTGTLSRGAAARS